MNWGVTDPHGAKMRVLMVLASPWWGGLEKMFVDLANEVATRCDVSVLAPQGAPYTDRFARGVEAVVALPPGSRRNPRTLVRLRRLIAERRPDVVHAHGPRAAEMVHWATLGTGTAHVATKHNTRRSPIFSHLRWVTAVSEQARASVSNRHGVHVVYNGIEARPVGPIDEPSTFTIVSVGRLHPYKGFDLLIRAAAQLDFDYTVEIVGEGPGRGALEDLVAECGLTHRVHLVGYRDDVPERLARAHLQVVPSRNEGFSLALLEGIHYSDVVLSTAVGIAPEVLPSDLLLDPTRIAEAITAVHDRRAHFVDRFRSVKAEYRDKFQLTQTVDAYIDLYGRAIGSTRPGP